MRNTFLHYSHVHVYFIYSFSWDITQVKFEKLEEILTETGWTSYKLNHRPTSWRKKELHFTYQPDMVSKKHCLQRNIVVEEDYYVIIPLEFSDKTISSYKSIPVKLEFNFRIFENGSGVCTIAVCLQESDANFQNIHHLLRLAPNISDFAEISFTQSYLCKHKEKVLNESIPLETLQDKFWNSFNENKHILFPSNFDWKKIWLDDEILIEVDQNNRKPVQSPFIVTVAEVNEKDYNKFVKYRDKQYLKITKEIGSITCKLTLDNRQIETDFENLSIEYIRENLPYDKTRNRLMNLCLDDRLYFSFSRRGAIALTSNAYSIPGNFVIPSLLNLMEILRGRWHLGNIVNLSLDKAITDAVYYDGNVSSELLNEIFKWRILYGLFLRDPVPHLFDGGSVTTIAELAGEYFWINKMELDTHRKFETLDKLAQDLFTRKRFAEFIKWNL